MAKEEKVLNNETAKVTSNEKTTTTKKEDSKRSKKPIYRVLYNKEDRTWIIKKDGAKRNIASFVTKDEAISRVKELSTTNDMNYIVHKKDGKFQKK